MDTIPLCGFPTISMIRAALERLRRAGILAKPSGADRSVAMLRTCPQRLGQYKTSIYPKSKKSIVDPAPMQ